MVYDYVQEEEGRLVLLTSLDALVGHVCRRTYKQGQPRSGYGRFPSGSKALAMIDYCVGGGTLPPIMVNADPKRVHIKVLGQVGRRPFGRISLNDGYRLTIIDGTTRMYAAELARHGGAPLLAPTGCELWLGLTEKQVIEKFLQQSKQKQIPAPLREVDSVKVAELSPEGELAAFQDTARYIALLLSTRQSSPLFGLVALSNVGDDPKFQARGVRVGEAYPVGLMALKRSVRLFLGGLLGMVTFENRMEVYKTAENFYSEVKRAWPEFWTANSPMLKGAGLASVGTKGREIAAAALRASGNRLPVPKSAFKSALAEDRGTVGFWETEKSKKSKLKLLKKAV